MLFKGVGKSGKDEIKSTGIQRGTENGACPTSGFSCSGVLIGRVDFHALHFEMRSVWNVKGKTLLLFMSSLFMPMQ